MKINYIEAHNFRSYEHFKFVLDNKGLILIKGQNGNIDERISNGSGKSSFIYALLYALYGETPDGAKGDEVIKNDVGKNCLPEYHLVTLIIITWLPAIVKIKSIRIK